MLAIAPSVIVVLFISRMAFTDFAEIIIYYVIGLPKAEPNKDFIMEKTVQYELQKILNELGISIYLAAAKSL